MRFFDNVSWAVRVTLMLILIAAISALYATVVWLTPRDLMEKTHEL